MKKILLIRFFALLLCSAMITEVSLPMQYNDIVSMEADSEMEHEESKEESKEKTSNLTGFSFPENESLLLNLNLISYTDSSWDSPSIDFQTPPPKLS